MLDVYILIENLEANWQWYHGLAVGFGSAVCIVVGAVLLYWLIAQTFSELSKHI